MAVLARHHRVALLDGSGERVLVVDDGLPRYPGRWPSPTDLAVTAGDPGAWVAGPASREPDGTITNVLAGSGTTSLDGRWVPLADLGEHGVSTSALAAVTRDAAAWQGGAVDDGRAAWFRPGWLEEVLAWVDENTERTGPPHPAKLWSLSAVLSIPTADRTLWFKATCDGFHGEAGLTAAVARLAPDVAPVVVAADADRAWLLLEDIPGADDADPTHAAEVAARLARLQLDSLDHRDELLAAGAPDRGRDATLAAVRDVLRDSIERPLMAPEQRDRLDELETWLVQRVAEYWDAGLPDVLSHGDLHTGNVAWVEGDTGEGRPLIFDWTDTCLSHPYLDVWHLAQDTVRETEDPAGADAVWQAFAAPWREARPDVDHDALWARTEAVEAAFQMVSYEQIYRAQPHVSRWELSEMVVEAVDRLLALMDSEMDAEGGVTRPTP